MTLITDLPNEIIRTVALYIQDPISIARFRQVNRKFNRSVELNKNVISLQCLYAMHRDAIYTSLFVAYQNEKMDQLERVYRTTLRGDLVRSIIIENPDWWVDEEDGDDRSQWAVCIAGCWALARKSWNQHEDDRSIQYNKRAIFRYFEKVMGLHYVKESSFNTLMWKIAIPMVRIYNPDDTDKTKAEMLKLFALGPEVWRSFINNNVTNPKDLLWSVKQKPVPGGPLIKLFDACFQETRRFRYTEPPEE
ncbi:hypothetical protein NEOLI_004815 [Neolecta irregularis DAH-3]|uniref:F-box domain-containing protein n=1 Tax=Neolecta irregularis (strain DAH-3) TaxID=1198029 RepID=A0A1U7LJF3_NEOID|nr:hypothetical protein NEOLI_004815 [Neolecta irregularis DAH-3]|eukprot:OLL22777.1 hypothetical protein NEOLI_004815 [Neolecta irregularis DAH-3]